MKRILEKRLKNKLFFLGTIVLLSQNSFSQKNCDSLNNFISEPVFNLKEKSLVSYLAKIAQYSKLKESSAELPSKLLITLQIDTLGNARLTKIENENLIKIEVLNLEEVNQQVLLKNSWLPALMVDGKKVESCVTLPLYVNYR
ncbi:MAG: hypothetical protein V4638_08825 [Bacteroidota bacterium]